MSKSQKKKPKMHPLMRARFDKAEEMRGAGHDPYANDFRPDMTCADYIERFEAQDAEGLAAIEEEYALAGRVVAKRKMGKLAFVRIRDRSGELQLVLMKSVLGEDAFARLKWIDLGDFIGALGTPKKTNSGETSVNVRAFRVLTKSLQAPPEKFHGLADVEQRYRQRYIDLAMNTEVRDIFKTRARVISGIRSFLDARDYVEAETPVLGDVAGGAAAKPFLTHHNTLGMDLQMRIATELHLKRLVVGGLERVYEIGRLFRNEGISTRHNPEFTTIEFYEAYANYLDLMELSEAMIGGLVKDIHGKKSLEYNGNTISFEAPWRRASIAQLVCEKLNLDDELDSIDSVAKAMDLVVKHCADRGEALKVAMLELSDEELYALVPGIEPSEAGAGADASKALKGAKVTDLFYAALGQAVDGYLPSVDDEKDAFEGVDTAKFSLKATGEKADVSNRTRRRRLALALIYSIFDECVESDLIQPTFVTGFSVLVSPLARKNDMDPALVDRFELMVGGMEIANAFSELNDPLDQKERFLRQARDRARGNDEAPDIDHDFINALEFGMPPTAGQGIGIDRLVMLLTGQASIREVILFPQMKKSSAAEERGV